MPLVAAMQFQKPKANWAQNVAAAQQVAHTAHNLVPIVKI